MKIVNILNDKNIEFTTEKANYIVCTIAGNVDHGKTFLLNKFTGITVKEDRGITQTINSFAIDLNSEGSNKLILLDTPGHQTFSFTKEVCMDICDIVFLVISMKDIEQYQFNEWIKYFEQNDINFVILLSKVDSFANLSEYRKSFFRIGLNNFQNKVYSIKYDSFSYAKDIEPELTDYKELTFLCQEIIEEKETILHPSLVYILNKEKDKKHGLRYSCLNIKNSLDDNKNHYIMKEKASIEKSENNIVFMKTSFPLFPGDLVALDEKNIGVISEKRRTENVIENLAEQLELFFIFASSENKLLALENIFNKLNLKISKSFLGLPDTIIENMIRTKKAEAIFFDVNTDIKGENVFFSNNVYDIEEYLLGNVKEKMNERALITKLISVTIGKAKVKAVFEIGKSIIAGCDSFDVVTDKELVSILRKGKIIAKNLEIVSMRHKTETITSTKPGEEVGFILKNFTDFKLGDILHFHRSILI